MMMAVDVHYSGNVGVCAAVTFEDWGAATPTACYVHQHQGISEYQPGKFYLRELPVILGLISACGVSPNIIVVDGYVFLDGYQQPGLGKHLYDALDGKVPIIGIAKSPYREIGPEFALRRGNSKNAIYVTSVGVDFEHAKQLVGMMHGKFRLPDIIRYTDQLSRTSIANVCS